MRGCARRRAVGVVMLQRQQAGQAVGPELIAAGHRQCRLWQDLPCDVPTWPMSRRHP